MGGLFYFGCHKLVFPLGVRIQNALFLLSYDSCFLPGFSVDVFKTEDAKSMHEQDLFI